MFKSGERVAVCASGKKKEFFAFFFFLSFLPLFFAPSLFSPPDFTTKNNKTLPGGKDSTALAHILKLLNERHGYGLDLFLLSVDEGISGYRDDSLATVRRNEAFYGLPLTIVSFEELFGGMTVDRAAQALGTRSRCTLCGVLRRQALDRGAARCRADKLATGHNADDVAETLLLNLVRGDAARMARCGGGRTGGKVAGEENEEGERGGGGKTATTAEEGTEAAAAPPSSPSPSPLALPRVKPFLHTNEKEIVLYAHHKRLDYFCTECSHAKFAARGGPREAVKAMEAAAPAAVAGLVRTAVALSEAAASFSGSAASSSPSSGAAAVAGGASRPSRPPRSQPPAHPSASSSAAGLLSSSSPGECERCGGLSSGAVCKACELLGQLALGVDEKGRALAGSAGGGGKAAAGAAPLPPGRKRVPVSVAFEA